MCGICGQYSFGSQAPVLRQDIERMTNTLIHRGPDDEGYHVAGPLGFGFRRLSIIDLAGGHQPMSDREETVWVVFNGEIYNFRELRQELESRGHRFQTKSDTEVIVHGYKQWGTDVFDRLNGMFGVTIFKGIEKLAPGTMLVFEGGRVRRERWYRYTPVPFSTPKREDEACHELLEL